LPGFGKFTNFSSFQAAGKYHSLKHWLTIELDDSMVFLESA